jgi:chorismate mutase
MIIGVVLQGKQIAAVYSQMILVYLCGQNCVHHQSHRQILTEKQRMFRKTNTKEIHKQQNRTGSLVDVTTDLHAMHLTKLKVKKYQPKCEL